MGRAAVRPAGPLRVNIDTLFLCESHQTHMAMGIEGHRRGKDLFVIQRARTQPGHSQKSKNIALSAISGSSVSSVNWCCISYGSPPDTFCDTRTCVTVSVQPVYVENVVLWMMPLLSKQLGEKLPHFLQSHMDCVNLVQSLWMNICSQHHDWWQGLSVR